MKEPEVLAALKAQGQRLLPKARAICNDAIHDLLKDHLTDLSWIKKNFSLLVEQIQIKAYKLYLQKERAVVSKSFKNVFSPLLPKDPKVIDFFNLFEENFWALDRLFLSLSQGRRGRAGKTFEYIIKDLFNILKYPYDSQPLINGQPDFLLPSASHFQKNAMDCIIFTVKRTLRERWRQIVTEGTRGYLFFLATIDEKITSKQLQQIQSHRIYVVVPNRIKNKTYSAHSNVISFETFFKQHIDPAMRRWQQNKII